MLLVHLCFQQLPSSQGLMISVPFKPTQLAGKHLQLKDGHIWLLICKDVINFIVLYNTIQIFNFDCCENPTSNLKMVNLECRKATL